MRKKILVGLLLLGIIAVLSGCMSINEPITADSEGIWNKFFVLPMSQFITFIANLFSGSYGWSIVVVTIIVRLILVPLNVKQIKSSIAMQALQPKIKELQAKYTSKDAATTQKLQQETMALFSKHGANPLAGCFPALVQMPILIAMYHAIMRTPEIKDGSFLWFELGAKGSEFDPIVLGLVLPILAAVAMFYQQKLMMSTNTGAQNPQMTAMLYMMPIMIGVFAFILPAALGLYWVVGNIFAAIQTLLIRNPMMKKHELGGDKE